MVAISSNSATSARSQYGRIDTDDDHHFHPQPSPNPPPSSSTTASTTSSRSAAALHGLAASAASSLPFGLSTFAYKVVSETLSRPSTPSTTTTTTVPNDIASCSSSSSTSSSLRGVGVDPTRAQLTRRRSQLLRSHNSNSDPTLPVIMRETSNGVNSKHPSSSSSTSAAQTQMQLATSCQSCGDQVAVSVPHWMMDAIGGYQRGWYEGRQSAMYVEGYDSEDYDDVGESEEEVSVYGPDGRQITARRKRKVRNGSGKGKGNRQRIRERMQINWRNEAVDLAIKGATAIKASPLPSMVVLTIKSLFAFIVYMDQRFSLHQRFFIILSVVLEGLIEIEKEVGVFRGMGETASVLWEASVKGTIALARSDPPNHSAPTNSSSGMRRTNTPPRERGNGSGRYSPPHHYGPPSPSSNKLYQKQSIPRSYSQPAYLKQQQQQRYEEDEWDHHHRQQASQRYDSEMDYFPHDRQTYHRQPSHIPQVSQPSSSRLGNAAATFTSHIPRFTRRESTTPVTSHIKEPRSVPLPYSVSSSSNVSTASSAVNSRSTSPTRSADDLLGVGLNIKNAGVGGSHGGRPVDKSPSTPMGSGFGSNVATPTMNKVAPPLSSHVPPLTSSGSSSSNNNNNNNNNSSNTSRLTGAIGGYFSPVPAVSPSGFLSRSSSTTSIRSSTSSSRTSMPRSQPSVQSSSRTAGYPPPPDYLSAVGAGIGEQNHDHCYHNNANSSSSSSLSSAPLPLPPPPPSLYDPTITGLRIQRKSSCSSLESNNSHGTAGSSPTATWTGRVVGAVTGGRMGTPR